MRATVAGILASLAALWASPPPAAPADSFVAPPPAAVVRVAALGRELAAADVLWLATVQMVGHPDAEARHYPFLDEWLDIITLLDPRFDYPYAFVAVLLSTDDARVDRVDAILARGEAVQPDSFWFPLQRGFLAYFGKLDSKTAAVFYRRASTKAGAPPYVTSFARKLEETTDACAQMPQHLSSLMRQQGQRDAAALRAKAVSIVEHCVQSDWRQASGRARLERKSATIDELVKEGLMAAPPSIPGLCWRQGENGLPHVGPCAGAQ